MILGFCCHVLLIAFGSLIFGSVFNISKREKISFPRATIVCNTLASSVGVVTGFAFFQHHQFTMLHLSWYVLLSAFGPVVFGSVFNISKKEKISFPQASTFCRALSYAVGFVTSYSLLGHFSMVHW